MTTGEKTAGLGEKRRSRRLGHQGNRAITGKNALIIIGMALIPVVNIVVAIVAVALSVAVFLDMCGFFTWVENTLDRIQKITLFADRK